jgi:hypothetical protein
MGNWPKIEITYTWEENENIFVIISDIVMYLRSVPGNNVRPVKSSAIMQPVLHTSKKKYIWVIVSTH